MISRINKIDDDDDDDDDVKNNKFIIWLALLPEKMSAIISTTPQSRPTSTANYFSISSSTRLLVLAIFLC